MKKTLVVFLVLVLIFAHATLPLAAASQSGNVTGVWGGITPPYGDSPVYSVQIAFDSMTFTYKNSDGSAAWSSESNTVTVANYSNADMAVALAYVAKQGYPDIRGSFGDDANFTLESAANTTMATAANRTAALTLSGTLASDQAAPAAIGSITVTVSVAS